MENKKKATKNLDSKKGNIFLEIIIVVGVIITVAIITLVMNKVGTEINTEIQSDTTISNTSKTILNTQTTDYSTLWDNLWIFIFIGMWATAIILSFFIDANPIFFILLIFLVMVLLVIGAYLSNIHQELLTDTELATSGTAFPKTNHIIENILVYIIAMATTIGLSLYAKNTI